MARPKKIVPISAPAPPPETDVEVRKTRPPVPRPEELQTLIRTAAYFRAEKDAFRQDPLVYWKEAEYEVRSRFQ